MPIAQEARYPSFVENIANLVNGIQGLTHVKLDSDADLACTGVGFAITG